MVGSHIPQRVWQPIEVVVRYLADLFEFATGPKTFLLSRWPAPGFLAASGMFFAASLVLIFLQRAAALAESRGTGRPRKRWPPSCSARFGCWLLA